MAVNVLIVVFDCIYRYLWNLYSLPDSPCSWIPMKRPLIWGFLYLLLRFCSLTPFNSSTQDFLEICVEINFPTQKKKYMGNLLCILTDASSLIWCPVWVVSLFCCMKVLDLCHVFVTELSVHASNREWYFSYLLLLVSSPWASLGRNQSPVRRPVWLWHAASRASS